MGPADAAPERSLLAAEGLAVGTDKQLWDAIARKFTAGFAVLEWLKWHAIAPERRRSDVDA